MSKVYLQERIIFYEYIKNKTVRRYKNGHNKIILSGHEKTYGLPGL
jgi:hypothetical protein